MATPFTPNNFFVQSANQINLITWDVSQSATSYSLKRSTDGITYSVLTSPTVNSYLDESVTIGQAYWYQVASVNSDGTSQYTSPQMVVPTISGEMCLAEIRQRAQQRSDMINSQFVDLPEWNKFINAAYFELYDLLVTAFEDYFCADPASFQTDGNTYRYTLPNGVTEFQDDNGDPITPRPFYKLLGVDMAVNQANNAYVTVHKYNFIDRNRFLFPNTNSTLYGVFNLRYRLMGDKLQFIPTPSAGQIIRLWFVPRLEMLLQDMDITQSTMSGWIEYVYLRAAKYALDKEESDTTKLDEELVFIKKRIEEASSNRDVGEPDTISDVRGGNNFGQGGFPGDGFQGGF